jgi:hypothetical protein
MKLANSGQNTNPTIEAEHKGVIQLNTIPVKTKAKRPSKGVARHNRRVKQEARKYNIPGTEVKKSRRPVQSAK